MGVFGNAAIAESVSDGGKPGDTTGALSVSIADMQRLPLLPARRSVQKSWEGRKVVML